jgi:hypothetical protein
MGIRCCSGRRLARATILNTLVMNHFWELILHMDWASEAAEPTVLRMIAAAAIIRRISNNA